MPARGKSFLQTGTGVYQFETVSCGSTLSLFDPTAVTAVAVDGLADYALDAVGKLAGMNIMKL